MNDKDGADGGTGGAGEGLVTGSNHGRGAEDDGSTNPEEFASTESDLALSNQVGERETRSGQDEE